MEIEANIPAKGRARIRVGNGLIQSVELFGDTMDHWPFIAPGMVDIQVNGFAGVDFSDPEITWERAAEVLPAIWKTGVTSFCPTLITNMHERLVRNFRALADAVQFHPQFAKSVPCFHLEGPYISPGGARGAHNPQYMREPNWSEFEDLQEAARGRIGIVTLAPELPGAMDFIMRACAAGVLVSVGHTDASTEQIHQAVEAGARLSTHLGNGCPEMMHRHQSPLWAQLAIAKLNASLICDGIHLPPDFVNVALRAKGIERCILITDAVMAATLPPGRYRSLDSDIELLPENKVVLANGRTLAGSAATLNHVVDVFRRFTGAPLVDALAAATTNPARLLGGEGTCSGIAEGQIANLFLFRPQSPDLGVVATFLGGELVSGARPQL